jgi:uncharacterized protein (DUF433 family)
VDEETIGLDDAEGDALLGAGLYSLPEAARIIGTNPRTLRQWAKTYRYTARGVTYTHEPVIYRYLEDEGVLTFLELIELYFVRLFRSAGVSMPVIRKAAQAAAQRFDTPYPFAVKRFDTDGTSIFATLSDQPGDHLLTEDLARGQYAFTEMVRPYFRKLDYRGNAEALRFWPRDHDGRIVLDPRRQFGAPIDAETGVQTRALYDAVTAGRGQSFEEVARWFEVPVAAVEAAVDYERSLVAA